MCLLGFPNRLAFTRPSCWREVRLSEADRPRRRASRRRQSVQREQLRHEHLRPSTSVPTEASGWRSTVLRSIARPVPQPGQKTSSQGVPDISAALMVGDHSMSRPVARRLFQRDGGLCLDARCPIRLQPASLNVETSSTNKSR
jgi:hypothetical protein